MNKANANKPIWTCLSPLKDMWLLSSWTPSIWGPWWLLSLLEYSLPLWIWLSFDVISLSPFDINFQEGLFWTCDTNGLVLESQSKAACLIWCWQRTRIIEWSWSKQKSGISGKLVFLWWNRWLRVVCFGCTERFRLGQREQTGVTLFIRVKPLVTSAH